MTPNLPRRHSVWLCPEPEIAVRLQKEIARFARASGTDMFEPHVTLLGDLACTPQTTLDVCRTHFGKTGPIAAEVSGLTQTNAFYMSLFFDILLPPSIQTKRSGVLRDVGLVMDASFRPHLSLAYGLPPEALPKSDKRALQEKFSGIEFHLTSLAIVASGQDVPIKEWTTLEELPLA